MEIQFLPFETRHLAAIREYREDPVTKQFNPIMPQTLDELKNRLTTAYSDWSLIPNKDSFFWSVSDGENIVGTASLQSLNQMMLTAEIGYGVFAGYRSRGVGEKIVNRLTDNCFRKSNLRKLIAFVHEENVASRRVLEKNQYVQEGLLREHFLVNGHPVNEVLYGILRRDFPL